MAISVASPPHQRLEREFKFAVATDFELPDLRPIVGRSVREPEVNFQTAYFDTRDLRLLERGLTLRHRTGEEPGPGTWTLKIPLEDGGPALGRQELTWPGPRDRLPDGALAILRGVVRRDALDQVVELRTGRLRWSLEDGDGQSWAELDLDDVTVVGGPRDGRRYRELEIEVTGPAAPGEALEAVARAVRRAGATSEDRIKLAKALSWHDDHNSRSPAGRLSRKSDLAEVVRASVEAGLGRLLDHDYLLRLPADTPDERAVHQARVATRRLRSDLRTLKKVLDPIWLKHTTEELRWIGGVLGAVRDDQVLDRSLGDQSSAGPVDPAALSALRGLLTTEERAAVAQLAEALVSPRYIDLLDRLHAAAGSPPMRAGRRWAARSKARKALPAMVRSRYRKIEGRVANAGDFPSDQELHRVRIAAKNLRYACELARPVVGKRAARVGKQAKRLQTVLGAHHDASAVRSWLAEALPHSTTESAFVAGVIAEAQAENQARLARRWRQEWSGLAKHRPT